MHAHHTVQVWSVEPCAVKASWIILSLVLWSANRWSLLLSQSSRGELPKQANVCNIWYQYWDWVCTNVCVWVHVCSCCVWSDLKSFGRGLKKSAFERKWAGSNGRLSCAPRNNLRNGDDSGRNVFSTRHVSSNQAAWQVGTEVREAHFLSFHSMTLFFKVGLNWTGSQWIIHSESQHPGGFVSFAHILSSCLSFPFFLLQD